MESHFTSLGDEVVPDLNPADEVEWEEEEDLTSILAHANEKLMGY